MLKIEFKEPVNGRMHVICKGISVDPMNDDVFLIQLFISDIWQTPLKNIKHVSSIKPTI